MGHLSLKTVAADNLHEGRCLLVAVKLEVLLLVYKKFSECSHWKMPLFKYKKPPWVVSRFLMKNDDTVSIKYLKPVLNRAL